MVREPSRWSAGHAPCAECTILGKIELEFDLTVGRCAAELAVLGCLASLEDSIGSLDGVRQVTDAASKLLVDLFGDSGRHARTTVGVASLPNGVAVEIELIARLRSG